MSAGRVTVNDEPAVLGQRVDVSDRVAIDGKPCYTETAAAGSGRVIGVHKPADVVCTRHDPEGRPTIFELLPATARRWVMVGRLDLTTSGLVLFTDDGELAHRLTHPSYQIPRRYAVRVLGTPEAEVLAAMLAGVAQPPLLGERRIVGERRGQDRPVAAEQRGEHDAAFERLRPAEQPKPGPPRPTTTKTTDDTAREPFHGPASLHWVAVSPGGSSPGTAGESTSGFSADRKIFFRRNLGESSRSATARPRVAPAPARFAASRVHCGDWTPPRRRKRPPRRQPTQTEFRSRQLTVRPSAGRNAPGTNPPW
jgi:hypothetical protein